MRRTLLAIASVIFLGSLLSSTGKAQSYLGKQRSIQFSGDRLMQLFGSDLQSPDALDKVAKSVFNASVEDLLAKAKASGVSPEITEATLYISGEKVRWDGAGPQGNMSQIIRLDQGRMYSVMWDQKKVMVMSAAEIEEAQKKAQQAMKQLQGMEGMLENLPPEARARLKAQLGGTAAKKEPKRVTRTGRRQTVNGFPAEEVIVESASEKRQLWITQKHPGLRKSFESMMKQMSKLQMTDEADDESEIWEKIPNGWPVLSKELKLERMTREISLSIEEMQSMELKSLAPDTFEPPKDFERVSMQEMWKGRPQY